MARAPADKKSPPRASRSATSTASTAKPKRSAKKDSFDVDWPDWNALEQEEALKQGWGVFICVDEKTKKVFLEIQAHGKRFKTDNAARDFVLVRIKDKDALAQRAATAVFRSKVDSRGKTK